MNANDDCAALARDIVVLWDTVGMTLPERQEATTHHETIARVLVATGCDATEVARYARRQLAVALAYAISERRATPAFGDPTTPAPSGGPTLGIVS